MCVLRVDEVQNLICYEFILMSIEIFRIQTLQLGLTLVKPGSVALDNRKKDKISIIGIFA